MKLRSLLLMSMIVFMCAATSAHAAKMPESSPTHVVGFIFHKLANTEPDYIKWADAYLGDTLRSYGDEGKKVLIHQTRADFRRHFRSFSLRKNREITINIPAKMEIVPFEKRYFLNITLSENIPILSKETPEFKINIVVPELEERLKPIISPKSFQEISESGIDFMKPRAVNVVLRLEPMSVDAEKPLMIHNEEHWLMLGKFLRFEVWDASGGRLVWKMISEEERQKNLDDLRSLYKTDGVSLPP